MNDLELRRPAGGDYLRGAGSGPALPLRGNAYSPAVGMSWFMPASQPVLRAVVGVGFMPYLAAALAGAALPRVSAWEQPISQPVIQKPVPAQSWGQFAPVLAIAGPEVVTVDKWSRPFSQPVLPKPRLNVHPYFFAALAQGAGPSSAFRMSWYQPASGIVRPAPPRAPSESFFASARLITNEQVFVDKWFSPWSLPVRPPPRLTVHQYLFAALSQNKTALQAPTMNSWFMPWSQPVLPKPRLNVHPYLFAALSQSKIAVSQVPSLATWYTPWSLPVQPPKRLNNHSYLFAFFTDAVRADTSTSVASWGGIQDQPRPLPSRSNPGPSAWGVPFFAPAPITLDRWFFPNAIPVLAKDPQNRGEAFFFNPFPLPVAPETITLDKWFQPQSQPVLPPVRVNSAASGVWPIILPIVYPGTWHPAISQPVLARPTQNPGPSFFFDPKPLPNTPVIVPGPDGWGQIGQQPKIVLATIVQTGTIFYVQIGITEAGGEPIFLLGLS